MSLHDEITLELARLERAAHRRAREVDFELQTDDRSWLAGEAGVEPAITVLETVAVDR